MQFARLPNFLRGDAKQPVAFANPIPLPSDLLYSDLAVRIIDVLTEVQQTLGPGFLHQVYRRSTRIELTTQGVSHQYIKNLPISFAGQQIGEQKTRLLYIDRKMLVATVALREVLPAHTEKLRWAMGELQCQRRLLANFYSGHLGVRFFRL